MSVNPERGEIELELGGATYVLRPTFEARAAFEKATGLSLVQLAQTAADGSMPLDNAAIVVTECVKAWGKAENVTSAAGANVRRIGELIYEADGGLMIVLKRLQIMLILAATGGYTASGFPKPKPEK